MSYNNWKEENCQGFRQVLTSTHKAGVQRVAALCRGFGGVPQKSLFLSSPPQAASIK
jgi:hypothetical protein